MKKLLALFTLLIAFSAFAGGPDKCNHEKQNAWNRHHGWLVEGGVGINAFYALLPVVGNQGSVNGWGIYGAIGYNFLENVAAEGGFMYSSDLNARVDKQAAGINFSASAAAKLYIPYLALRFGVPVGDRFSFIFKLGGMYPFGEANLSGTAGAIDANGRISGDHLMPFSGLGATLAVTPQLEITAMYQGAVYVMASGAVLTLGLTYHFG